MSFHHPQDRHRDRKEQIHQQFQEARDRMTHTETGLPIEEGGSIGASGKESEEERRARFEQDIERRLDLSGQQIRREHERRSAGSES